MNLEIETAMYYPAALRIVVEARKASIGYLQRRLQCGYAIAARIITAMEDAGIVSPPRPSGHRTVHWRPSQLQSYPLAKISGWTP